MISYLDDLSHLDKGLKYQIMLINVKIKINFKLLFIIYKTEKVNLKF